MYDEQENNKLKLEQVEQEEEIKRQKSIQRLFRFSTLFLFLLFISFTVASTWQNKIRQNELEITKQNLSILSWDNYTAPEYTFTISTTTNPISEIKPSSTIASWYDYPLPGLPDYSKNHFTAASRDYPRGTLLIVCKDEKTAFLNCVQVRVNDFGPDKTKHPDRAIDLSSAAFSALSPLSKGLLPVKIYKTVSVHVEPLKLKTYDEDEGSKIDESEDKVFINPIHKPVEL